MSNPLRERFLSILRHRIQMSDGSAGLGTAGVRHRRKRTCAGAAEGGARRRRKPCAGAEAGAKKHKKSKVASKAMSPWVKHVKAYAKKHKCTYGEAMSRAAASWK